ncbi:MAG: hypothetical protein KGL39_25385 [Patescibacteria group bacterium]|nr:hypothetical protein [Patescibacteria group bacterium]
MKFTKIILALCATLIMASVSAFAQSGQSLNFIGSGGGGGNAQGNSGNMWIVPATTNLFNGTDTYQKGGTIAYGSITNPLSGITYTNGQIVPTYVTNTSGIADVRLWANRDGTPLLGSIGVDVNGINAAFTNTLTFNFATLATSAGLPSTSAQNQFSFSIAGNGTNDVVMLTNLPTGLIQGAQTLRLTSYASSQPGAAAGTNGFIVGIWLNGYKPDGN